VEDIRAVCEHLRTEGVTLDREPVVGLDGNWQAWVKDPDGNAIELMQLSEDAPQRRAARSAGERDG
jgi:catechol 2,3-dioxygenase-like lactoylglutathione lyase family enzyme